MGILRVLATIPIDEHGCTCSSRNDRAIDDLDKVPRPPVRHHRCTWRNDGAIDDLDKVPGPYVQHHRCSSGVYDKDQLPVENFEAIDGVWNPDTSSSANNGGILRFCGGCKVFLRLSVDDMRMEDLVLEPVQGLEGQYLSIYYYYLL